MVCFTMTCVCPCCHQLGGGTLLRAAVAVSTECELPQPSCSTRGAGKVFWDASASLPLGWSEHFTLLLALKERTTLCSITFVLFLGSPVFRRTLELQVALVDIGRARPCVRPSRPSELHCTSHCSSFLSRAGNYSEINNHEEEGTENCSQKKRI